MKRKYRNTNKKLPTKYVLLILTTVCFVAILLSLTLNISVGPLKNVAGYIFVPMQKGINNIGTTLSDKANDFKTLGEVMKENEELKAQMLMAVMTSEETQKMINEKYGEGVYSLAGMNATLKPGKPSVKISASGSNVTATISISASAAIKNGSKTIDRKSVV